MFVLISPTISEIQGFKISLKKSQPLIFAETLPRLCCPGETRFPAIKERKKEERKRNLTQLKTFLETAAPDKVFSKTAFSKYLKKPFQILKKNGPEAGQYFHVRLPIGFI